MFSSLLDLPLMIAISLQSNTALTFGISNYDYESKVIDTRPISFYERNFTNPKIKLLTLSDKEHNYLDIDASNHAIAQANKVNWFWALVILIGAIFFFFKPIVISKKEK